jgi:hypothetical protein
MILSDRENKLALARGHIRITPPPEPDRFSSMAIDLCLDEELSVWESGPKVGTSEPPLISPKGPDFDVAALLRDHGRTFALPPEGFVLA